MHWYHSSGGNAPTTVTPSHDTHTHYHKYYHAPLQRLIKDWTWQTINSLGHLYQFPQPWLALRSFISLETRTSLNLLSTCSPPISSQAWCGLCGWWEEGELSFLVPRRPNTSKTLPLWSCGIGPATQSQCTGEEIPFLSIKLSQVYTRRCVVCNMECQSLVWLFCVVLMLLCGRRDWENLSFPVNNKLTVSLQQLSTHTVKA